MIDLRHPLAVLTRRIAVGADRRGLGAGTPAQEPRWELTEGVALFCQKTQLAGAGVRGLQAAPADAVDGVAAVPEADDCDLALQWICASGTHEGMLHGHDLAYQKVWRRRCP